MTNFTRIKAGSMLRAHGGYLIFNLEDALTEPAVWKTLKRTLKSGHIAPETYEPFSLFSAAGLQPQPVAIQLKLIVVGSPSICITACMRSIPSFKTCSRSTPTFATRWNSAASTVSCTASGSAGCASRKPAAL